MHVEIEGDVYFGPGLGTVTSGDSLRALNKMDNTFRFYRIADDCVKRAVEDYFEKFPSKAISNLRKVSLKMTQRNHDSIVAVDVANGIHVRLYTNKEGTGFTGANVFMLDVTKATLQQQS